MYLIMSGTFKYYIPKLEEMQQCRQTLEVRLKRVHGLSSSEMHNFMPHKTRIITPRSYCHF